jgi:hypothetical protein
LSTCPVICWELQSRAEERQREREGWKGRGRAKQVREDKIGGGRRRWRRRSKREVQRPVVHKRDPTERVTKFVLSEDGNK